MHETKLNAILVKSLKAHFGDDIDVSKRHGDMYSAFYPDIEGCLKGRSFYIEGKIAVVPKRKNGMVRLKHKLSEGQTNKIKDLVRAGASVYMGLYFMEKSEVVPFKSVLLIPCVDTDQSLYGHILRDSGFSVDRLRWGEPIYEWGTSSARIVMSYEKQLFKFREIHCECFQWSWI